MITLVLDAAAVAMEPAASACAGTSAIPRLSVVIPTCRRPELLARCLAAVLSQRIDPQAYEIIVVDDGCSDETRAVVEALAPSGGAPAVTYMRPQGEHGLAVARNTGRRAARGAVIAYTDDDTVPAPDWLAAASAP